MVQQHRMLPDISKDEHAVIPMQKCICIGFKNEIHMMGLLNTFLMLTDISNIYKTKTAYNISQTFQSASYGSCIRIRLHFGGFLGARNVQLFSMKWVWVIQDRPGQYMCCPQHMSQRLRQWNVSPIIWKLKVKGFQEQKCQKKKKKRYTHTQNPYRATSLLTIS